MTPFETTLLGLILAAISAVVSWIITHYYFERSKEISIAALKEDYRENLRTYALKAAEKVSNLSNELNILATYIDNVMEPDDDVDAKTALLLSEQKFAGIVHIVRTLKSMNDTSLSDWGGVIGEELERKKQEEAEREGQLEGLLTQINSVLKVTNDIGHQGDVLNSIKSELKSLGSQFRTNAAFIPKKIDPVLAACPRCTSSVSISRSKRGKVGIRAIECPVCEADLIVQPIGEERESARLMLREKIAETITCPKCQTLQTVLVDNFPASSAFENCAACSSRLLVSRSPKKGLSVEIRYSKTLSITDESLISKIQAALPVQPWEKGVHKKVAEELGLRGQDVQSVIQILISRGVFKDQRDGILLERIVP